MAGYRSQSDDTHPDVDRMVFERLRMMTPVERLRVMSDACESEQRLVLAGLRHDHPHASEPELRMRAAARRVGRATMLRFFGERALAWLP